MTEDQVTELMSKLDTIGSLVTWLYVLVAVVGLALGLSLRKVAKNQVAAAELLKQGVARIESDLPDAKA